MAHRICFYVLLVAAVVNLICMYLDSFVSIPLSMRQVSMLLVHPLNLIDYISQGLLPLKLRTILPVNVSIQVALKHWPKMHLEFFDW